MDQRSRSTRCRLPLGDVTNTNTIGVPCGQATNREDSKERKRQKDRERYAAMSQDKKEELNRRRRERRKQNNVKASCIEEGENSECLHMEHVDTEPAAGDEMLMSAEMNGDGMRGNCIDNAGDEWVELSRLAGSGVGAECTASPVPHG